MEYACSSTFGVIVTGTTSGSSNNNAAPRCMTLRGASTRAARQPGSGAACFPDHDQQQAVRGL
jgi:hypothetical protein